MSRRALRRRYGRAQSLSASELRHAYRWYGRKYGLKDSEVRALLGDTSSAERVSTRVNDIEGRLEAWRERNGLPAPSSALTRGKLLALIRGAS